MTVNVEFWQKQRFERVTDPDRTPVLVGYTTSDTGGTAFVQGDVLADGGAIEALEQVDRDLVSEKGDQAWLAGTGLVHYEFTGTVEEQLRFVAQWRLRARELDVGRVDLHYVLTGEPAATVPRGGAGGMPWTMRDYVAPSAWGAGAPVVAVLDTGVDPASVAAVEELDANGVGVPRVEYDKVLDVDILGLTPPVNGVVTDLLSEAGHGTFIASIIARFSAGAGRIAVLRVLDPEGIGTEQSVVNGLRRLRQEHIERHGTPVVAVNLSLGGFTDDGGWLQDPGERDELYPPELRDQMPAALAAELSLWQVEPFNDTVFVCAAGNDGQTDRPFWPAALAGSTAADPPLVVAVASLDGELDGSSFSNRADWVTVSTLGEDIAGTYPAGRFPLSPTQNEEFDGTSGARWSGTSFAAPLVTAEIVRRALDPTANTPTGRAAWGALALTLHSATTTGFGDVWDPRIAGLDLDPRA